MRGRQQMLITLKSGKDGKTVSNILYREQYRFKLKLGVCTLSGFKFLYSGYVATLVCDLSMQYYSCALYVGVILA